jgi:hypothetical protein
MKTVDSKKTSGAVMRAESPFFAKENGQGFFDAGADKKSFFPSSRSASPVQAKLNIGRPDDAYEKEADAVADKVVQSPPVSNGDQPAKSPAAPQVQQKCDTCDDEQKLQKLEEKIEPGGEVKKLQRKPIFESKADAPDEQAPVQRQKEEPLQKKESDNQQTSGSDVESRIGSSKGHGESLPKDTRSQMESSIGADFSGVKIHDNAHAAGLSKDLHAQAFTQGNDIYFNSGKYDPHSNEGRHLLAHELTHTVQQSGGKGGSVQPQIQKKDSDTDEKTTLKSTSAEDLEKAGKNCDAGFITKKNRKPQFHINELKSKKYKLPDEAVAYFNQHKPSKLPVEGTRDTHQDTEWKKAVRAGSKAKLMALGEFTKDEKPESGQLLRLRPKSDKAKKKGIVGTFTQIVNESLVPNWDFKGSPKVYQIEHSVDWQILGNTADNIDNFILLENKENLRVAKIVEDAISKALEAIAKFYAKDYKDVPMSAREIKSDKNGAFIDKLDGGGKALAQEDYYSSKALTEANDKKNPFKDELIVLKEEVIPEGYFLLSSSDRRASYLIPKDADGKVVGAFKITVQKSGDKVTSVEFENRLDGKSTEIGVDKSLKKKKVEINGESKDKYVVQDGAEKATIGPMLKSLALTRFSPIEIDDKAIVVEGFDVSATGKVKSTLSFLEGVDISFSFENGDFNVKAVIPLDAMTKNIPKPFKVDYCNIEIGGGTNNPIYIGGGVGFSIERLGTGDIFAKLDKTGVTVEGSFEFESKYFNPATITVAYVKGEWSITGTIGIKKDVVKGVKSATLKVGYDKGIFTIGGEGELDLPGIDKISLLAVFAPNGDFTFTATVQLKKLPGIKSGSATVVITSKGEEGLKIGITGEAEPDLPKVPGLEGIKLTISYQDGIFEIRTKIIYKKGKFDGTIEVGVTNKQVDEKGKPLGEAAEKGDVVVFGYGELGVDIYNGIHGTVTVRLTPEKDVLIGGKIEKKELKPFGDGFNYDKEIIPFPELEIPLVGIPGMSVSAFIKGGVHFKFSWDPLVLKDLSVDFKETDINQLENASIEIIGSVGSSAHAEVYLAINAGLKARVLVATLTGTLGGEAGLGLDAEAGGKVDATWDMKKGLVLKEIRAFLNVVPKAVFRLTGDVSVDLDLWIASVNLYYHKWILAEKQLDLSGITLKVDFPIKFDEQGHVLIPNYESMNVEKPNFSGDSGKKILDDAVNGDAKKEEEAKKEEIRAKIKTDMHSADNKDVSPSEYTKKMMDKYEKSPDLQVFVKTTIEDEAKKMEYGHFEEQKQIIRNAKVPLSGKFSLLNMFMMFHGYIAEADVEAFRGELTRQDEEQKRQQALAASAGTPPDNNPGAGSDPNIKPPVQKKAAFDSEEEETVSGKEEDNHTGVAEPEENPFTEKLDAARSSGIGIPGDLRQSMESRMGGDFGNVRIHHDTEANALSKQIHAQAFATGNDIFFAAGKYDPDSKQGQHLLAHELTHVLQQEGGLQTKIQRHPVAPTLVVRKAQADIFGVGALPGMDLNAFKTYTGGQADWFAEPTLTAGDRNDLWKLLFKTRPGSPVRAGVGDVPVKELRAVTDAQWTDLEVYCRGCDSAGHTVRLHAGGALADRIALGGMLKILETGIPGIVLEATMTELQLRKIQTDGLILSLMNYLLVFHPHLQETVGSAAGLTAGTRSETQMLLDFVKAPGMLAYLPLFGRVRNLHRFAPDALTQLQNNFSDFSHAKPVYLILYSGHDYDSAFIRSQALFETILKDRSKLVLMLEGQDSLQDIIDKVPKIATDYGQPDAGGVNRIAQVMIAGHGSSKSVEMAGTGAPRIDAEGKVQYQTEDLDLDKNNAKTVKLLEVLMENLNPATARVVYAGCLVGSTEVPVKDAKGAALGAADVKKEVNNPARKSLAATTRDIAAAKGRGGAVVEGSRASVGLKGSASLMDAAGNFHMDYTFDPTSFGTANIYVATGKEPEGLLRAAVEVAAVDPIVAANQLRTRSLIAPRDAWYDPVTLALVREAISGVAPGAPIDIVKLNQLANIAADFFLSYWASRSLAFFGSEVNVNPAAANLYTAVTAIPVMAAPAEQETKEGRFILELGWSMLNPARSANVIAYLDARAELTAAILAKHMSVPWLNSVVASASLFPAGAAATDGRIRLALAWMKLDDKNADVQAFLNAQVNVAGPQPKLQPNVLAQLSSPADEEGILSALGRLVPLVPGIGGAADLPAANADAFPGRAPAMNDVRIESNPYEATVIPPAFVLNIRKQPTMKGEPFHWLKRGETVKVMGFVHQWAAVDINGKLGFAHGHFLSPPPR